MGVVLIEMALVALQRSLMAVRVAGRRVGSIRGLCSTQVRWDCQQNSVHHARDEWIRVYASYTICLTHCVVRYFVLRRVQ